MKVGAGLLSLSGLAVIVCTTPSFSQDTAHSPGWVVIPVSEYGALRGKAYPSQPEPELSALEATLTRVDYNLHVNGDLAAGLATLTVDLLKDGWVRVPVPAGLLVREARLDGRPVSLFTGEGANSGGSFAGSFAMIQSKRGRSVLTLDVALPIASTTGEERLSLPASVSAVTRASVTILRQDVDIRVAGGFLSDKSQTATESKWLAYGRGNEPLTFIWRRKTDDHRMSQPLRLRGSITELIGLGEESTSVYAEVNIEVTQSAAATVKIQVPETVTVNQVPGAMVADWELKSGELLVTFLEPVEKATSFVVMGETRLPREGQVTIPLLRLLNTERDAGGVAVEVLGAGEMKNLKSQGLETADASYLGQMVASRQSPSLAAFRFRAGPLNATRSLTVEVVRYAQQALLTANIEEARYRVLASGEGKTLVQARYAVRNNQRNFIKITLPAGAVVWSSSLGGRPVTPGQAPNGSLLFPLMKVRAGDEAAAFPIEILYLVRGPAWDDKGQATLTVPALDLPVSRTGIVLYYSPLFRITPEPGAFRIETYVEPSSPALRSQTVWRSSGERAVAPPDIQQNLNTNLGQAAATQALVDRFNAESVNRVAQPLPIAVSFPEVGPSLFLVSELTGENQRPVVELKYQKDKKAGAR